MIFLWFFEIPCFCVSVSISIATTNNDEQHFHEFFEELRKLFFFFVVSTIFIRWFILKICSSELWHLIMTNKKNR